jgi:exodeoxyribonuclease VII large subunit
MVQPSLFPPTAWSVADVNRYLRDLLESDHNLSDLWVQGEVSNFSRPRSGHLYFTLKDERAALRCVMWRNSAQRQTYLPTDGEMVEVHGSISVYEVAGQYQLYADTIKPLGEGALFQEFMRLKAKLEAEGLFDESRKRLIPPWPRRIGIVTSPTGAALRDMLDTLKRRYPLVEVILAPSAVQGREAPSGIVEGLQNLNRAAAPDVILLARGGGSIEDLWAFNDEGVARAIVASDAPVITGVGHQTDFTIADFVADLRAPTPTAAAELATPNRDDLHLNLAESTQHLALAVQAILADHRWQFHEIASRIQQLSPLARIQRDRQRLDEYVYRATSLINYHLSMQRAALKSSQQRLLDLNPETILGRGYAIVTQKDGKHVRSVGQVKHGDRLNVRLSDGEVDVKVKGN